MYKKLLECSKITLAVVAIVVIALLIFFPKLKQANTWAREAFETGEPLPVEANAHEQIVTPDASPVAHNEAVPSEKDGQLAFDNVIPYDYYFLDDGTGGKMGIQHNLCSKSCCSEQYPPPFALKKDKFVCSNKEQFVPTNIMCNNTFQDSGCLCMTKEQAQFFYNRGNGGHGSH